MKTETITQKRLTSAILAVSVAVLGYAEESPLKTFPNPNSTQSVAANLDNDFAISLANESSDLVIAQNIARKIQENQNRNNIKEILFIFVSDFGDRPVFRFFRVKGNTILEFGNRINVLTDLPTQERLEIAVDFNRPICFISPQIRGGKPILAANNLSYSKIDFSPIGFEKNQPKTPWFASTLIVARPVASEFTFSSEAQDSTGRPAYSQKLIFTESGKQDYSTKASLFLISRPEKKPAWGINAPLLPLGISNRLTFDAVTIFGPNQESDAMLGMALTYRTRLGSDSIEGYRGIFGFPIDISLSFGFEALDLGRPNTAKRPFLGIGLTIPTGGSKK